MYNRSEWFNELAHEIVDYLSEAMTDSHTLGHTKGEIENYIKDNHPDYTKLHTGIVLDVMVQKEIIDYYLTDRSEIPREVPDENFSKFTSNYVDFYYLRCYELTNR